MPQFVHQVPEGDTRERLVCATCGHIDYQNPKIIVGTVVAHEGRVLLCRRAIEPRRGFWTLPAGFLELGETAEEGAAREAWEEAQARVAFEGLLAVFSISRIGQVQLIFRARFADPSAVAFGPGPESAEVRLFAWEDVPWSDLAFPSVRWALDAWRAGQDRPLGAPWGIPPGDPRGQGRAPGAAPMPAGGL
jgi:ADP-ribose pyrophosphatase YjhB (NUDIX family)